MNNDQAPSPHLLTIYHDDSDMTRPIIIGLTVFIVLAHEKVTLPLVERLDSRYFNRTVTHV